MKTGMTGITERDKIGQGIHLPPIVAKLRARYYMMDAKRLLSRTAFLTRVTIALNGSLSLLAPIRTIIAVRSAFPIGMIRASVPFVPAIAGTESARSIAPCSVLKWLSALFADHGGIFSNVLPSPAGSVNHGTMTRAEGLFMPFLVKLKTALRATERWLGVTNSHTFLGAICSLCAWDIGKRFAADRANMLDAGTFCWHNDTSDSVSEICERGAFSEQRLSVGSKSTLAPRSIIA